jgi:hypothetical protein
MSGLNKRVDIFFWMIFFFRRASPQEEERISAVLPGSKRRVG